MEVKKIHPGHAPGWKLELPNGDEFIVWAPRPNDFPYKGSQAREHWSVCWENKVGTEGNFKSSDDFVDAFDAASSNYSGRTVAIKASFLEAVSANA